MVYLNQIVMKMINKSKQVAVLLVNVIQVKIHIVQNVYINQRRSQEAQGRNQSHHNQRWQVSRQMYAQIISSVLFCMLFAFLVVIVRSSFMSSKILPISIKFLCSRLKQVRRLSSQHSVAQQVVSCHSLTCLISVKYGHSSASSNSSVPSGITCSHAAMRSSTHATTFPSSGMLAQQSESRQFNDEFCLVCDHVQDSEHQKDESGHEVALKWAMINSGTMEEITIMKTSSGSLSRSTSWQAQCGLHSRWVRATWQARRQSHHKCPESRAVKSRTLLGSMGLEQESISSRCLTIRTTMGILTSASSCFVSYLKHIMVWSSRTELLHHGQSASAFVNQHVLYRESVSISSHFIEDSLLSIMTHQQARLTERVMSIIRRFHPHLEQLILRSGEFRQDPKDLEFSPSWTV